MPTYIIPLHGEDGRVIDAHIPARTAGQAQDAAMGVGQHFDGTGNARLAPDPLANVDGPLFRRQCDLLNRLWEKQAGWLSDEDQHLLDGLIHFTDAIADYLHDERGVDCLLS